MHQRIVVSKHVHMSGYSEGHGGILENTSLCQPSITFQYDITDKQPTQGSTCRALPNAKYCYAEVVPILLWSLTKCSHEGVFQ
eukprot:12439800-Ditylum_brightwellii.AAC.1